MAKLDENLLMQLVRGTLGKQVVVKVRAGKPYLSALPVVDKNRVPTGGQLVNRRKFKFSSLYATEVIKDENAKAAYTAAARPNQSAHNVAFMDAFIAPEVQGIIAQGYRGKPGDIIIVQATDNFRVKAVKVSIHDPAGELIETGDAVGNGDNANWVYTAKQPNGSVAGSRITATVIDLPGNEGVMEIVL